MNEQLVSDLIAALANEVTAKAEQTAAINRLAESNELLASAIIQALSDESEALEYAGVDEKPTYLSARRG
jgi:hypothetical protein